VLQLYRELDVFALALEVLPTFVWLFEVWLKCMKGRAPRTIITDQVGL
jgi:hypothetical protein